jgi:hypothetical protein
MIKLLDCLCKKCENKLRVCSKKTDLELMNTSFLKDNEIDILIFNDKQSMSIIVDKQVLYDFLKEDLGK